MGVDAKGYFVTKKEFTDEQLNHILADFNHVYYEPLSNLQFISLRSKRDFTSRCVEIDFDLGRYYGPHYARGNFFIYFTILGWLLRRDYVEAVYYGDDMGDLVDIPEYNKEIENELINLYLTSNDKTYRNSDHKYFIADQEALEKIKGMEKK